jgi:hypothetical protein
MRPQGPEGSLGKLASSITASSIARGVDKHAIGSDGTVMPEATIA